MKKKEDIIRLRSKYICSAVKLKKVTGQYILTVNKTGFVQEKKINEYIIHPFIAQIKNTDM